MPQLAASHAYSLSGVAQAVTHKAARLGRHAHESGGSTWCLRVAGKTTTLLEPEPVWGLVGLATWVK